MRRTSDSKRVYEYGLMAYGLNAHYVGDQHVWITVCVALSRTSMPPPVPGGRGGGWERSKFDLLNFMKDMGIMDMGILGIAEKHLSEASHDVSKAPPGS